MLSVYDKKGEQKKLTESSDFVLGTNYAKFPNGLAIVWGRVVAPANESNGIFKFPFPLYNYNVCATHSWSNASQGKVSIGGGTDQQVNILIYDFDNVITNERNADVIVIGQWKRT